MSRKKRNFTRRVLADPKFGDVVISKTVNVLMRHGKRSIAERALYRALDQIEKKGSSVPLDTFHKAVSNIKPLVEVRSRRVGGATYQVPTEVPGPRSQSLALRWLVEAANTRTENTISERLAGEIMEASQGRGIAMKKREDTHRMAEANKAFAHFKW